MIKLSVLKNRLSGKLSVGNPSFSVVSGILSVGNPNISVFSGTFSVGHQLWVSHPYPYPYPKKFSCSCMVTNNNLNALSEPLYNSFFKGEKTCSVFKTKSDQELTNNKSN